MLDGKCELRIMELEEACVLCISKVTTAYADDKHYSVETAKFTNNLKRY